MWSRLLPCSRGARFFGCLGAIAVVRGFPFPMALEMVLDPNGEGDSLQGWFAERIGERIFPAVIAAVLVVRHAQALGSRPAHKSPLRHRSCPGTLRASSQGSGRGVTRS